MMNRTLQIIFILTSMYLIGCKSSKHQNSGIADTSALSDTARSLTTNNRILGVARIEPEDGLLDLVAGTTGKIIKVWIKENQLLHEGQPMLTIDVALENAQLVQAQSKIATQQASIAAGKANVEALKVSHKNALDNYNRNLQLLAGKAQTQEIVDNSKSTVDKLVKDIEVAEANQLQTTRRLTELEADIHYYKTVINQKKIQAPFDGKVLKVLVKAGDYVNSDTKVAEYAPAGNYIAKTEVDELFAEKIQIGQKAEILSQSTGEKLAEGTVSFAADYLKTKSLFKDQSTEQEDRRVREVHVKLADDKKPLIGSRVDCLIYLK